MHILGSLREIMPSCCVKDCGARKDNNQPTLTLHRFPVNETRKKQWLDVIGSENITTRQKMWFVCSLHFDKTSINRTLDVTRLIDGAVPSLHLLPNRIQPDTSDSSSELYIEPCTSKVMVSDMKIEAEPRHLMICRTCLVAEGRMISITCCKLDQAYQEVTGLSFQDNPDLPQYLCPLCVQKIQSFQRFRQLSHRADYLLSEVIRKEGALTFTALKDIDRDYHELSSPLQPKHYSANHADLFIVEDQELTLNDANESIEEITLSTDLNGKTDIESDIFVDDLDIEPKVESENDNNDEEYLPSEDSIDENIPLEFVIKKRKVKVKKVKKESVEPKVDRRRKPFLNEDLNDTVFTITDLSHEEQMADIFKRQESSNFKNAVFKCMECFKGFLDEDAYNGHMTRHTNECGEFECAICKTHFKHSHALRKHVTAHHTQRFSCNQCHYVTTHRQTARLHVRWHQGAQYRCPHCPAVFFKFTTYMGHLRIKHPSDFVCELCGYSFVSAKGIELHKKLKHRMDNVAVPEDGPVCELCNVRFVSTNAYKKHLVVSARHNTDTGKNSKERRGKKRGAKETEETQDDDDTEEKRRSYPRQIRRKAEGPIPCEQCGMQLEDSRAYHAHFRRAHPDKNRTKYPSMKSPCMCELCGRIFQSYALLKDHRWTHTGERPFSCEACGKTFRMRQRLVAHRRVHSGERSTYSCAVCDKQFTTQSNRQRHMFIHTGLKPFKCEMCGKAFKHSSEKRAHVTYVHLKKPWPKRARAKRRHERQGSAPPAPLDQMWACDKMADTDKPVYYQLKM